MRVRHDGFLANRCRRTRLTQIRAALVAKTAAGYTYRVAYEEFVREPQTEVARVLAFLGIEASALQRREAVAGVSSGSIGKGRAVFDGHAINRLEPLVHETLARYGYA